MIEDLFSGGENGSKRSLDEIKEKILHYEDAFYKIMTLSEDEVNFRIFRVMSKKLKEQLGEEANKIKERIRGLALFRLGGLYWANFHFSMLGNNAEII